MWSVAQVLGPPESSSPWSWWATPHSPSLTSREALKASLWYRLSESLDILPTPSQIPFLGHASSL